MGLGSWWNRKKELINAGLTLNRAADQWEKDMKTEANPGISIMKGLKAIAGLAAFAGLGGVALFLLEPGVIEAALAAAGVNAAYAAAIVLVLRGAATAYLNYRKHNPPTPSNQNSAPLAILLLLLPAFASAQDLSDLPREISVTVPGEVQPAPEAPPAPRPEAALHCGAMHFAERGKPDHKDFVCRFTFNVPAPSGLNLFARADWTRTQDGGDLLDPKTFRSIEAFIGGRKDVGAGFAATVFFGATWNRDSQIEPTDPRLWTAAAGVRYSVPGRGYIIAAVGHHGPVGGSAFLGSITYEINDGASWFADVAVPLDSEQFALSPYTVKAGISARIKGWKF